MAQAPTQAQPVKKPSRWDFVFNPPAGTGTTFMERFVLCFGAGATSVRLVQPGEYDNLLDRYVALGRKQGSNPPKLLIYDSEVPNAMYMIIKMARGIGRLFGVHLNASTNAVSSMPSASAHPEGSISISSALFRRFNSQDVDGVLAHELSHFRHRSEMRTLAMTSSLAGAAVDTAAFVTARSYLGNRHNYTGVVDRLVKPLAFVTSVVTAHFAIDALTAKKVRDYEYKADREGALLTGNVKGQISVMRKLGDMIDELKAKREAKKTPEQREFERSVPNWVSTVRDGYRKALEDHPSIPDRITALERLDKEVEARGQVR